MSNEVSLQKFINQDFGEVRGLEYQNQPWLVGKDVATILGYKSTANALKRHVDEDDKLTHCFGDSGQQREMYIINESGFYSLVFGSKLPTAKKFKHWVTSEVLPSIRKHGIYATEGTLDSMLNNPDFGIRLLTELKTEREQRKQLETQLQRQKPLIDFA
ncbi:MAG: BRO family protein, partial [Candidatus Pacebacteria bacterium]|nr:BRO family protein [Candidatus Paceibacterota bacterium]